MRTRLVEVWSTIAARLVATLGPVWERRWVATGIGVGVGGLWGALAGLWMPRGPMTTGQALLSMALSLAMGIVIGVLTRNRWCMLAAPLALVVAYETVRVGTEGPLVDAPHLSTYGVMALAVGRGFHGLLSWVPMVLGVAVGAGLARAASRPEGAPLPGRRTGRVLRRTVAGATAVMLLLLAVGIARPARTAAIVDAEGNPLPDSIAELTTVDVDGHELALMVRGQHRDNPVVLFLAGGPGGSELGAMRRHLEALEADFTVVTWDQRGTGKSYPALDPTGTLTLDGAIADTLAVTDHLRQRFGTDRIVLMGQSWGSILGVLAVQAAPEKYAAYVGVGQMVSPLTTDTIFYEDTLAWAERTGQEGLADELRDIGPPPYTSVLDYETALSHEHEVYPYDHSANSEGEGGFSENFLVEEYTLLEKVHLLGAFMDTFTVLYPQIQDVDLGRSATRFDVPVFFVEGAHEARGRIEPFESWYPSVEAPTKDLVVFDTSGHRPLFEQPDEFVAYMAEAVLPAVSAASPATATGEE